MRDRRRLPLRALGVVCALLVSTSAASGGAVCEREEDAAASITADAARPSEWIVGILGEEYVAAKTQSRSAGDVALADFSRTYDASAGFNAPPAAVIPLPAPLAFGAAGLGTLVVAAAVQKLRKLL